MKNDLSSAGGTAIENRVGYGAYRGLICGLFTAWGLAVLYAIVLTVKVLTAQDDLDYEMMTFWEYVTIVGTLIIGWTLLFVPVGVIVGAILGAVGIIRKKKPANEPHPSEPEKPESN